MTNKKNKRIKREQYHTEEQIEVTRFIKILLIIVVLVLGVYFFTRAFITKDLLDKKTPESDVVKGTYNYNTTLIGNMLSKNDEEYYVLIYNSEDLKAVYYNGLITNYGRNNDALKVYFADLNNGLNKKYETDGNSNINTTNFDDFKVNNLALIKISNKKIIKALDNEEEIAQELEYKKN